MKPFVLSPLHQVEYTVPELEAAERFFIEVFGESEVECEFAAVLTNPALDIGHVGFGQTVQQLCQPLMEGLPHYDALQAHGPCVHNLCYLVDSIDNIVANCKASGFETLIEFPLTDIWRAVLDEGNLQGNDQSCIMDTRALLGFQLELAETPWRSEPQPPLMLPAHGPQWAAVGADSGNRLRAINVVVHNLDDTLQALQGIFGDNLAVLSPAQTDADAGVKSMLVELGRVPLAYHQPIDAGTELAQFLAEHGPLVHSLVAQVADRESVQQRLRQALGERGVEVEMLDCRPLLPESLSEISDETFGQTLKVSAFARVGVDFILF